jgi:SAM-dependent methyltransferase
MPNYGDPRYWDQRYKKQKDTYFDWLENYESLKPLMNNLFDKHDKILNVGCGNAQLTEDMYDDGYTSIVNTDISTVVIEQMRERNLHRPGMLWEVDDVLAMQYEDEAFDVVIDKSSPCSSGTIDAILCGKRSFLNAAVMLMEIQRVLKPGGLYLAISYGGPSTRMLHLVAPAHQKRRHLSFEIECLVLKMSKSEEDSAQDKHDSGHYFYVCVKNADASKKCAQHWESVKEEILKEQSEDPEDEEEGEEEDEEEEERSDQQPSEAESRLKNCDSADCISKMLETIKNEQIDSDIKLEILSKAVSKIKQHMMHRVMDD